MSKLVLYIEDNLNNMNIVQKVLESQGYNFLWSGNGLEGVEIAKRNCPDLVLVDINLPDITGLEVIKRIRACAEAALVYVPIIAITGYTSKKAISNALDAGCDVYMTKPVNLYELRARVEGFIGNSIN